MATAAPTSTNLRHPCRRTQYGPVANIAQDAGQADLEATFRIYTHTMKLDDGAKGRLQAIVNGDPLPELEGEFVVNCGQTGEGPLAGPSETPTRPAGFEPAASRSGGERSIH